MKIWYLSIIYEAILFHIYNRYRPNDLFWRTPVGDSFCNYNEHLTKDWNKNIIGDSITGCNWKIISKNISK